MLKYLFMLFISMFLAISNAFSFEWDKEKITEVRDCVLPYTVTYGEKSQNEMIENCNKFGLSYVFFSCMTIRVVVFLEKEKRHPRSQDEADKIIIYAYENCDIVYEKFKKTNTTKEVEDTKKHMVAFLEAYSAQHDQVLK